MANTPIQLDVRDERIHELIDNSGEISQIATGFQFTEGPVWHAASGNMIWSDIIGNAMYRWSPAAGVETFRQPSNMANGNTLDREGRLLTCEHATSRVVRAEADGSLEILAKHFDGRELNSPNDIVVKSDGAIYFTDPPAGRTARYGVEREQELPYQGVYRIDPTSGALTLLVDDFKTPNGLCFSIDEKLLFINDTARAHIRAFDVQEDGRIANGRLWAELVGTAPGVADGMKVDRENNLYCTGPGGIHIFTPDATWLGVIMTPERAANFTWGDDDGQTLYITATTSLYAVRMRVAGAR